MCMRLNRGDANVASSLRFPDEIRLAAIIENSSCRVFRGEMEQAQPRKINPHTRRRLRYSLKDLAAMPPETMLHDKANEP